MDIGGEDQGSDRPGQPAQLHQETHLNKQLHRASRILRNVFLLWREIAWTIDVTNVYRAGTFISFDSRKRQRHGTDHSSPFFQFPEKFFIRGTGREALLSYCACVEAQTHFVELTKKLFKNIARTIESVYINVARGSYTVADSSEDDHFTHHVLALNTPDKKSYIVDLSGAQVGLDTAIMPLEAYFSEFSASVRTVHDHAYTYARRKKYLVQDSGVSIRESRVLATQWKMHEALHAAAEKWEKDHRMTVADLLALPRKKYRTQMQGLYRRLEAGLRAAFREQEILGHPRGTGRSLGVVLTTEEKAMLKQVTLSKDPAEGELSGIRRQWKMDIDEGVVDEYGQEIEDWV